MAQTEEKMSTDGRQELVPLTRALNFFTLYS